MTTLIRVGGTIFERLLPWLVFIALAFYTAVNFFVVPYHGFFIQGNGQVGSLYLEPDHRPSLQINDRLIQIGSLTWADFTADIRQPLFAGVQPGQIVPLVVERNGQRLIVNWQFPSPQAEEVTQRLFNTWWIAYAFWLIGTVTLLLARPRDTLWRLLVAFNYLTALWLITGSTASFWHLWESATLLRVFIWLSMPVYLHLHWHYPTPLAHSPSWVWPGLYLLAAAMAVAHWLQWLPPALHFLAFSVAIIGSLLLLSLHFALRPTDRAAIRFVFGAAVLALVPTIVFGVVASVSGYITSVAGGGLLFLPILPLAYFYAIYRQRLGGLELRVNRAISIYAFLITFGLAALIVIPIIDSRVEFAGDTTLISVMTGAVAAVAALTLFASFRQWFERRLLGVPYPPADLIKTYTGQVAANLDRASLIRLLREAVLPSLLIRQSALRLLDEHNPTWLFTTGLTDTQLPNDFDYLSSDAGQFRPPDDQLPPATAWVRLVIPLVLESKPVGIWLLGACDPDDFYSQTEIELLQTIAAQTAIALRNIEQTERLRVLYQNDIDQRETERASLARELHDNALNLLSVLRSAVPLNQTPPGFAATYTELVGNLRGIVTELRPSSLNYGLRLALEDLMDRLTSQSDRLTVLSLQLDEPAVLAQPNPQVDLHLYRIIQQACDNALRHAHATTITVQGTIRVEAIDLVVVDDGLGFELQGGGEASQFLARSRFGLAGMHERAQIIGANLQIQTRPGHGTQVRVRWQPSPTSHPNLRETKLQVRL